MATLYVMDRARRSLAVSLRFLDVFNLEFGLGRLEETSSLGVRLCVVPSVIFVVRYTFAQSLLRPFALEARDAAPVGRRER